MVNNEDLIIPNLILNMEINKSQAQFETDSPESTEIRDVACGPANTFIITNAGELYGTGSNYNGQLGLNPTDKDIEKDSPTLIMGKKKVDEKISVVMVACGFDQVLAVTNKNKLYSWGSNEKGQLGRALPDVDTHDIGNSDAEKDTKEVL